MIKMEIKSMHMVLFEVLLEKLRRKGEIEENITASGILKGSVVVFELLREDLYKKYNNPSNIRDEDLDREPYITKTITFDDYESVKDNHPFSMEIDEFLGTEDLTARRPKESPEISFGIYRYEKLDDRLLSDMERKGLCQKDNSIYYATYVLREIANLYGFDVKFSEIHSEQIPYPGSVVPLALGGNKSIKGFGYVQNSYTITLTERIDEKHYNENLIYEIFYKTR